MFMAAGLVYAALGHDRIADLAGVGRAMPVTVLAFAVAGIALMGVVPSGAYLAKKLLLGAAGESGQWWWALVLQGGASFTAGYVVLVLVNAFRARTGPAPDITPVSRLSEAAALALAACSLALAFAAVATEPGGLASYRADPAELGKTLLVVLAGLLLALGLARRPLLSRDGADTPRVSLRGAAVATGIACERLDAFLRRWPSAGIALLLVATLLGALLV
jgi:NADH:ubiquinone oxidoreductase subunit 5 (subunit L)/multisubunit Na+/H+ antiporter MnhA subunit